MFRIYILVDLKTVSNSFQLLNSASTHVLELIWIHCDSTNVEYVVKQFQKIFSDQRILTYFHVNVFYVPLISHYWFSVERDLNTWNVFIRSYFFQGINYSWMQPILKFKHIGRGDFIRKYIYFTTPVIFSASSFRRHLVYSLSVFLC